MNIVLAHGILGFKNIGPIDYFNKIEKHLKVKYNANVLITKVDPTGSITERGSQLKNQIISGFDKNEALSSLELNEETHTALSIHDS